ncbi:type II secretion system F family protein [Candidatus Woesebacteria bacterium]|nr:type II secretion system F family protein [Candidatus Woesebacteria bacterium]
MAESRVKLGTNDKIALIGNLSTMLTAGIPILEAVDSLASDVKGNQKKILEALKEDLTQGKRVHTTMARFPRAFDKVTVNVIKAAEEAGNLDVALKDLRKNIIKEAEFASKVKSAMVYPAFIGMVFLLVLGVILFFVIPKISSVFSRLTVELPVATKVLIFLSDLMVKRGILVVIGFVIIAAAFYLFFTFKRRVVFEILFSLPLISQVVYKIDLTRLSRSLYLLLSSGIPITHALELTQDVAIKRETGRMIARSREMVLGGKSFSSGLRTSKKVPNLMIKLVEAGEKTGTLDKSLAEVSEHFDYEVTNDLKTLTTLIEPIMLVLIGVTVGGLMLAIIGPIYGLIGSIGNR